MDGVSSSLLILYCYVRYQCMSVSAPCVNNRVGIQERVKHLFSVFIIFSHGPLGVFGVFHFCSVGPKHSGSAYTTWSWWCFTWIDVALRARLGPASVCIQTRLFLPCLRERHPQPRVLYMEWDEGDHDDAAFCSARAFLCQASTHVRLETWIIKVGLRTAPTNANLALRRN